MTTMRNESGRPAWGQAAAGVARGSVASLLQHWGLALFSLVAAFAIWFVIQDVENPRVTACFPEDCRSPAIEVEAVNADRLIPNEVFTVRVEVEGREGDLSALAASDFEATIDVQGIPASTPTEVPVKVRSTRDGVKVLVVEPSTWTVTLEPLEEREFEVRLNPSGQLTAGFRVDDLKPEPLTVKVSGLRQLLDTVVSVDLDVNLAALNEGTNVIEGELTARGVSGSEIGVTINPGRGKVTYLIEQLFVQRSLPVSVPLAGQLAPGYRVANIVIEPPVISVSGPANEIPAQLFTEPIQLTNANSEIRLVRNIVQNDNLALERRQVSVRIEIRPIECTGGVAAGPCGAVVVQAAAVPIDQPTGLVIVTSPLRVNVHLTGPLTVLDTIVAGQITARVSLAGGLPGPGAFPVTVVIPANLLNQGVRAEQPPTMTITLGPGP